MIKTLGLGSHTWSGDNPTSDEVESWIIASNATYTKGSGILSNIGATSTLVTGTGIYDPNSTVTVTYTKTLPRISDDITVLDAGVSGAKTALSTAQEIDAAVAAKNANYASHTSSDLPNTTITNITNSGATLTGKNYYDPASSVNIKYLTQFDLSTINVTGLTYNGPETDTYQKVYDSIKPKVVAVIPAAWKIDSDYIITIQDKALTDTIVAGTVQFNVAGQAGTNTCINSKLLSVDVTVT